MKVLFSTLISQVKGQIVALTVETDKIYDVYICGDGSIFYAVNTLLVPQLPDVPATRLLLKVANNLTSKAVALLTEKDVANQKVLWWQLKKLGEAY